MIINAHLQIKRSEAEIYLRFFIKDNRSEIQPFILFFNFMPRNQAQFGLLILYLEVLWI